MIKFFNTLAAIKWLLGGIGMFFTGFLPIMSFWGLDVMKATLNLPIPQNLSDFALPISLILLGLFALTVGANLFLRKEWAAFGAGLIYMVALLFLVSVTFIFTQNPDIWLSGSWRDFYARWFWFLWIIWGMSVMFLLAIVWFFLLEERRHIFYAETQISGAHLPSACSTCGILSEPGQCPNCDLGQISAELTIGIRQRKEKLGFVIDRSNNTFRVGKSGYADIELTEADVQDKSHFAALSKKHFEISYDFNQNDFFIKDTSTHGTWLNNNKIDKEQPIPLANNSKINLAQVIDLEINFG